MELLPGYLEVLVVAVFVRGVECTSGSVAAGQTHVPCNDVKHMCKDRVGCSLAWHNYKVLCQNVQNNDVRTCDVRCERALIVLFTGKDGIGRLLLNCTCRGDDFCEEQQKLQFCSDTILKALDDSAVVNCSLARLLCEADSSCHTAFQLYMSHCQPLRNGLTCTLECQKSVALLHRQERAEKLKTCICNVDPEYKECKQIHRVMNASCILDGSDIRQTTNEQPYKMQNPVNNVTLMQTTNYMWLCFVQILIPVLMVVIRYSDIAASYI